MAARDIAKAVVSKAEVFGSAKGGFVVLPLAEYRKLCEAYEDALDLLELERARRENAGQKGIPWEDLKRQLGIGGKSKSAKKGRKRNVA